MRYVYGGGAADYFAGGTGTQAPVYDTAAAAAAQSSAGRITDLMSADGSAAQNFVIGNAAGYYSFQGPDGRTTPLWASDGRGGSIRIDPRPDAAYIALAGDQAVAGTKTFNNRTVHTNGMQVGTTTDALQFVSVGGTHGPRFSIQQADQATGTGSSELQLIPSKGLEASSSTNITSEILLFNKTGPNYERCIWVFFGDQVYFSSTQNGSGTARSIYLKVGGSSGLGLGGPNSLFISGDGSANLIGGPFFQNSVSLLPTGTTVTTGSVVAGTSCTLSNPITPNGEFLAGSTALVAVQVGSRIITGCTITSGSATVQGPFIVGDEGGTALVGRYFGQQRTTVGDDANTGSSRLIVGTRTRTPSLVDQTDESAVEFRAGGVSWWRLGQNTGVANTAWGYPFELVAPNMSPILSMSPTRLVTGVTVASGSTAVTAAAGTFLSSMVGQAIYAGTFIANRTTITAVAGDGSGATLSTAAIGTGSTSVTVGLARLTFNSRSYDTTLIIDTPGAAQSNARSQIAFNVRGTGKWTVGTGLNVTDEFQFAATGGSFPLQLGFTGSTPKIGFLGAATVPRQSITGSRGGNAAVASVIALLVAVGLGTDNTTA